MKKLVLSIFTILFCSYSLTASHLVGGEISYEHLTGNNYKITMKLYRDCSGINAPSSTSVTVADNCGNTGSAQMTLQNPGGTEVSQISPAYISQSTCNGGNLFGVQVYIYEGTTSISSSCITTFSWSTCCRNASTNVPTSNGDGFYIESILDATFATSNNSPVFPHSVNFSPIYHACINQANSYNFGVTELDGDSLYFELIDARETDANTLLIYGPGYSGASPIPGMTIDHLTGQLNFTPVTIGNFIISVKVSEYNSSGQFIGSMIRDIQFLVVQCTNNVIPTAPSSATNLNNVTGDLSSGYYLTYTANSNVSFDLTFSDNDPTDVLSGFSNVSDVLPGATYTVSGTNPLTFSVNWPVPAGFNQSRNVAFSVSDFSGTYYGMACTGIYLKSNNSNQNVLSGSINSSGSICEGESATITFDFVGGSLFDAEYSDGVNSYFIYGASNTHQELVYPTSTTI